MIDFVKDDGGRNASGYKGTTGDCVARAIAIATEQPYHKIYSDLSWINLKMPKTKGRRTAGFHSAAHGIYTRSVLFKRYMSQLGFVWTHTMEVGSGCVVHLRSEELPTGRLVVSVSRHLTAVINGVIHDLYDPSRAGTRCVYGYWRLEK